MADSHEFLKAFSVKELADEIRSREETVALKVWVMEDLVNEAGRFVGEELGEHLSDEEWKDLEGELSSGASCLECALQDCRDEEWDAVDGYVFRVVNEFMEGRKGKSNG